MAPPNLESCLRPMARLEIPTLFGPASGQRTTLRRVGARLFRTVAGRYEREQSSFLRERLTSASTFFDVGAAEGHFVRLASRVMPAGGVVVAFEPDPVRRAELEQLSAQHTPGRIMVRPEAVGDEDTRTRFLLAEGIYGRLAAIGLPADAESQVSVEVPVRSIDSLVLSGEIRPPDVVKIDTEGAELAVLAGMVQTLSSQRPVLMIECHSMPLLRDVLSVVLESGYGEVRVTRGGDHLGPPCVLAIG